MNTRKMLDVILIILAMQMFTGCGRNYPTPTIPIIGGVIQGKVLSLTGTVTTLAGTSASSGANPAADGIGPAARFYAPIGITTDGTNLYISDTFNHIIRKIDISTETVTTLAGNARTIGASDGSGATATFHLTAGITTDGTNLYVTEGWDNTIRKIAISTGIVTTLAGTAGTSGSSDNIGPAASFSSPQGITTDGTNLYVTDTGNSTVRKVEIPTGAVTTLAGTPGVSGTTDSASSAARFYGPQGITTDGTNLYVADTGNSTIRKIVISTGAVTTLAGIAGSTGAADGVGATARFSFPTGITTDGTYLYVTEIMMLGASSLNSSQPRFGNNLIRKIEISTGTVTTLAGTVGNIGAVDGIGAAASFFAPHDITTDGKYLYVTDTGNNTIRKIH